MKRATSGLPQISKCCSLFQSTPSVKRATKDIDDFNKKVSISIHTLCEEGDDKFFFNFFKKFLFQSTPSVKRATRLYAYCDDIVKLFQSTPSVKRATLYYNDYKNKYIAFQSTPSVKRATRLSDKSIISSTNFNPHPL